ncbi:hypothetical protein MLD38_040226 [Melastoma candidum]|uniref:Uncharacterized protein n=1 Tax=Melastoma candidum TaxID=119954 RepID=A0ACB9L600_9MYRT|nr:hypothetical protein MLD38_040226 [Melastoma candidum]
MDDNRPRGYRFFPTEEELLTFYLHNQLEGRMQERLHRLIPVINFHDIEPWDLPQLAGEECRGDPEQWFFFAPRQEQENRGGRPSRTTPSGYWKTTGSPSYVYSSGNRIIGLKKSMVFYTGKAPAGRKTKWKLNEYKAIDTTQEVHNNAVPQLRSEYTLCRGYVVSGSNRAFDRRPSEAAAASSSMAAATGELVCHEVGGGSLNPEGFEDFDAVHGGVNSNEDAPLWEWEQLNWF